MTAGRELLAVAGTHGKTTTAAMLAVALQSLGLHEPRALVGADVPQFAERLGAAVGAPASPHFVLEADEYDGAFLQVSLNLSDVPPTNTAHYALVTHAAASSATAPWATPVACGFA